MRLRSIHSGSHATHGFRGTRTACLPPAFEIEGEGGRAAQQRASGNSCIRVGFDSAQSAITFPLRSVALRGIVTRFDARQCSFPRPSLPIQFGLQCFCRTTDAFENAVDSDKCSRSYPTLSTGDATTAYGGLGAISFYQRTDDAAPAPATVPASSPPIHPKCHTR